jgi:porin
MRENFMRLSLRLNRNKVADKMYRKGFQARISASSGFCFSVVMMSALFGAGAAMAQDAPWWQRERLSGDWGGSRTQLAEKGIEVGIAYIGENMSVVSGGLRRGTSYEGRLDLVVDTDLERLIGWRGAKTHIKAFQIHNALGRNIADFTGSISDPSNIDALPTTRLFTAWFQQDFGGYGSLRIGQLAADDEFLTNSTASGLINGTFGWANVMAANLPSGGAAFPLSAPGVRLQINLSDELSVLASVVSGDPAGRGCYTNQPDAHPQRCNRHGTTFSFSGGALWVGKVHYSINQGKDATGLAGSYKVGGWYHSGDFADQHYGVDAAGNTISLALQPDHALHHHGNWGIYGVIDQMIWRGTDTSVSLFARASMTPNNRNFISWYVDGGIGVKGLLPGRADDVLTFGVAHSHISKDVSALDRDMHSVVGSSHPMRSGETVFELSYILQMTPAWTLQPDIQYIVRPGGGVLHPEHVDRVLGNALVMGVRSTLTF